MQFGGMLLCLFLSQEPEQQKGEWVPTPIQKELYSLHVRFRDRRGIFCQRLDGSLCNLAQQWAQHMASVGRMYHSSMSFNENIAYGYGSCQAAMNAWINSSGHNANLACGREAVGFGAACSANGTWYWCSLHGGTTTQTRITVRSTTSSGYRYGRFRLFRRWR